MSKTVLFMHVTDRVILQDWTDALMPMFTFRMVYHVGSSLTSKEWRDVDLVCMLPDEDFDALSLLVDIDRLNLAVSLWGQRVTGLPIDFKVQRTSDANAEFKGLRSAIGVHARSAAHWEATHGAYRTGGSYTGGPIPIGECVTYNQHGDGENP